MKASKKTGFSNTISGKLNQLQNPKHIHKQIDIDDLEIQMISGQFLNDKTVKKPFRQLMTTGVHLDKTSSNGVSFKKIPFEQQKQKIYPDAVILNKKQQKKSQQNQLRVISFENSSIRPAYCAEKDSQKINFTQHNNFFQKQVKDNNTLMSAFLKKGIKVEKQKIPTITVSFKDQQKKSSVGPAESKLKNLFNKSKQPQMIRQSKSKADIDQQINISIEEDYDNESFQKDSQIRESIAFESMMKQSINEDIRQSIAVFSISKMKESINQEIKESIAFSESKVKESIRQDIPYDSQSSIKQLKEEINEEISGSKEEEIYEDVFEQESGEGSFSKSQSKFRKKDILRDSDSGSHSKSFRSNIIKALKSTEKIKEDQIKPKLTQSQVKYFQKQKMTVQRIQKSISKLLDKPQSAKRYKNSNLLNNFKIQVHRLLRSDNFQSKIKKLVKFLGEGNKENKIVNEIQDGILQKVMKEVSDIKNKQIEKTYVHNIKSEYENKLQQQLKKQEVNLRAQMNQKIADKDFQLKKMIAQLQARMSSKSFVPMGMYKEDMLNNRSYKYDGVESDQSIDSDNVSWKADLWDLLPEYQKKKLYEKQTAEVTRFLTDVMMKQLKEQPLDRSIDISFQFPEEVQNQFPRQNYSQNKFKQSVEVSQYSIPPQSQKFVHEKQEEQILTSLPKFPIFKPKVQIQDKEQTSEEKIELIRKDESVKPEIIKILSGYKNTYMRKRSQAIRKIIKLLSSKDEKIESYLYSSINEISILNQRQFKKDHAMYVKAYEQTIIWSLAQTYSKNRNKKTTYVEAQLNKNYERVLVLAQIEVAQMCCQKTGLNAHLNNKIDLSVSGATSQKLKKLEITPCPIEIAPKQAYMQIRQKQEQKKVQKEVVDHIMDILGEQFAKQFRDRRRK